MALRRNPARAIAKPRVDSVEGEPGLTRLPWRSMRSQRPLQKSKFSCCNAVRGSGSGTAGKSASASSSSASSSGSSAVSAAVASPESSTAPQTGIKLAAMAALPMLHSSTAIPKKVTWPMRLSQSRVSAMDSEKAGAIQSTVVTSAAAAQANSWPRSLTSGPSRWAATSTTSSLLAAANSPYWSDEEGSEAAMTSSRPAASPRSSRVSGSVSHC